MRIDIAEIPVFVFGPLTLLGGVLNLSAAISVLLGKPLPTARPRLVTWIVTALCFVGVPLAAAVGFAEWEFWYLQIPLVSTFLLSGAFAAPACAYEHPKRRARVFGPAFFFGVTWLLAVTPLAIAEIWPHYRTNWRANGSPTLAILQFIGWSFGGPMPDCVVPDTEVGFERGVGYPPRFVTVPMSTILIAAWTSIVFSVSTLGLRRIRNVRARVASAYAFAPMFGTVLLILRMQIGPFDPFLFHPEGMRNSGVWQSDPLTMRTFGLVLSAGLLCSAALLITTARAPRSESEVVHGGTSG